MPPHNFKNIDNALKICEDLASQVGQMRTYEDGYKDGLQDQHEETWAMAMRTILKEQQEHKDDMDLLEDLIVYHMNRCPPLQTTNEDSE